MLTWEYVCKECQARFKLPVPHGPTEEEAKCPECGSTDVEALLTWEYVCHHCQASFELPVPRGPTEEKEAKCSECGSTDIERLTALSCEVQPCPG